MGDSVNTISVDSGPLPTQGPLDVPAMWAQEAQQEEGRKLAAAMEASESLQALRMRRYFPSSIYYVLYILSPNSFWGTSPISFEPSN